MRPHIVALLAQLACALAFAPAGLRVTPSKPHSSASRVVAAADEAPAARWPAATALRAEPNDGADAEAATSAAADEPADAPAPAPAPAPEPAKRPRTKRAPRELKFEAKESDEVIKARAKAQSDAIAGAAGSALCGFFKGAAELAKIAQEQAKKLEEERQARLEAEAKARAEEAKRAEAAAREAIRTAVVLAQSERSPLAASKALEGAVALAKAAQLTESSEPLLANVTRALADATRALAEPASPAPAPVKNTEAKKAGGFSLNPFKKNEKAEKPAAGAPAAEITATGEAEATKETAEPPKPTGGVMGDPFIASDFNGFKDGYDFKSGGEKGKGYYKK